MNLTDLNKRLSELRENQEKVKADFYVLQGQIQDCEFWIEKLSAKGEETPPKPHLVEG